MTYIADSSYLARGCKYPFCSSVPRFLLTVDDPERDIQPYEYVVCGKHAAPGLSESMEYHEKPVTVWALPRMPRPAKTRTTAHG